MSTIDFRGHKLWYTEAGQGPAMLFLHNGGNDHRIWDQQMQHFSRTHRAVVVDHLGYGQYDKPRIEYDLPLYRDEVATLVETLDLAPVHLVGHCIGGAMALAYALAEPQNVASLTLSNVATEQTLCAGPFGIAYQTFSKDRDQLEAFLAPIEAQGLPEEQMNETIRSQFAPDGPGPSPEFEAYLRELYNRPGQMRSLYTLTANWKTFAAVDQPQKPDHFPPTLLLWSNENQVLPAPAGEAFAKRLQPDRFERLEGCGHLAMVEQPDRFNSLIDKFLASVAATA